MNNLRIRQVQWAIVVNGVRWEFTSLAKLHAKINDDLYFARVLGGAREIRLFLNNRQIYRGPWGEGIV